MKSTTPLGILASAACFAEMNRNRSVGSARRQIVVTVVYGRPAPVRARNPAGVAAAEQATRPTPLAGVHPWIEPAQAHQKTQLGLGQMFLNSLRLTWSMTDLAAKQAELHRLQTETEAELASFTPALLAKAFRGEL